MGIYSICIGVNDLSNNETLAKIDNAVYIQVTTTYTSWAHFLLPGKWSMD